MASLLLCETHERSNEQLFLFGCFPLIFFSVFLSFFLDSFLSEDLQSKEMNVIRAAMDVGSGATKMTVARMILCGNRWKIKKILFSEQEEVLYAHDWRQSGPENRLSDAILEKGIEVLRKFKTIAINLAASEIYGVGTAVFRESCNGLEFLDRVERHLAIPIRLVSQQREGKLGVLSAIAASNLDHTSIISWDSGGSSFQLAAWASDATEEGPLVHLGPLGSTKVTATLMETVQGRRFVVSETPNPVRESEAQQLFDFLKKIVGQPPNWLTSMISNEQRSIVAIGGRDCLFAIATSALDNQNEFDVELVWRVIRDLCGKTDEELHLFPQPEMVIPKLVLLATVMQQFSLPRVQYFRTNGLCEGLLLNPSENLSFHLETSKSDVPRMIASNPPLC